VRELRDRRGRFGRRHGLRDDERDRENRQTQGARVKLDNPAIAVDSECPHYHHLIAQGPERVDTGTGAALNVDAL
jgi:hypothetical protein